MNILPQSTLRIVRQLTDPFDTDTNYVQAVVRNSTSGDIVATLSLTDKTGQRFTGEYTTPPDNSGMGYYLDVTTTVYTDAGYTTKNTNYAIEAHTYFVHQPPVHLGGGGGADVNYEKIRKIVKELLDEQEKTELPEIRDLTPELLASERRIKESVTSAVSSIRIPEQVRPDLDGAVSRISDRLDDAVNTLLLAVDQKEVTPETDLSPVMQSIDALPNEQILVTMDDLRTMVATLQELVNTQQDVDSMRKAAEEFMGKVSPRTLSAPKEKPKEDTTTLRARRLLGV